MSKWIFSEDYELTSESNHGINLGFAVSISQHIEEAELVIFPASSTHTDPLVLKFKSKELCQTAYDNLKFMLKAEK